MAGRISYLGGIVKDGLVLHLDAAKLDSYPRVGTTWTDLSGNVNNGILTNGLIFNSGNGGYFILDGTDDYVSLNSPTQLQFTNTQPFTLSFWCMWTEPSLNVSSVIFAYALLGGSGSANRGYYLGIDSGFYGIVTNGFYFDYFDGSVFRGIQSGTNSVTKNVWFNVTCSSNSSNSYTGMKIYLNGSLISTSLRSGGSSNPSTINYTSVTSQIGARQGQITFEGRISNMLAYNKELSSSEVLQNYNALKGRYL